MIALPDFEHRFVQTNSPLHRCSETNTLWVFYIIISLKMPTPFESALLNLKLFELRREPVLREARDWFLWEFNPATFAEFVPLVSGTRNASFRMVLGYWDMAASLVTNGAIDGDAFRAAHGEIFATFSKVQPFLEDLRAASHEPDFCKHIEAVVLAAPDAETILTRRREAIRAAAQRLKAAGVHESENKESNRSS